MAAGVDAKGSLAVALRASIASRMKRAASHALSPTSRCHTGALPRHNQANHRACPDIPMSPSHARASRLEITASEEITGKNAGPAADTSSELFATAGKIRARVMAPAAVICLPEVARVSSNIDRAGNDASTRTSTGEGRGVAPGNGESATAAQASAMDSRLAAKQSHPEVYAPKAN